MADVWWWWEADLATLLTQPDTQPSWAVRQLRCGRRVHLGAGKRAAGGLYEVGGSLGKSCRHSLKRRLLMTLLVYLNLRMRASIRHSLSDPTARWGPPSRKPPHRQATVQAMLCQWTDVRLRSESRAAGDHPRGCQAKLIRSCQRYLSQPPGSRQSHERAARRLVSPA